MRLKEGFVIYDLCGTKVVLAQGLANINFDRVLSLSESAAWLWEEARRQGDFTVESLAKALCDEYEITPSDALADVSELVAQWQKEGVCE